MFRYRDINWKKDVFGTYIKNFIKNIFRLYPIIVPRPELTYKMLNRRGVDAYMGVT